MNWDDYFFNLAENVKLKSKDESFKCGALIVGKDNEIVSSGYNSFPRGINDDLQQRQERPEKYKWIEHAERNAIYNAARIGVSTKGCSMYITANGPCVDCARAIINSGITKLYIRKETNLHVRWEDSLSTSNQMLREAGIKVVRIERNE